MHASQKIATGLFALLFVATIGVLVTLPPSTFADEGNISMYRLYNPNSGEHFYTGSAYERDRVIAAGWNEEGIGWVAPSTSETPVYRLYNPNAGDHHYTKSAYERDHLISVGWSDEGIGWYSDDAETVAVLRQYNPNAWAGAHNFTTSQAENDSLVNIGWNAEGIAWYAVAEGSGAPSSGTPIMRKSPVSAQAMAALFNAKGKSYPSELAGYGAAAIQDFARIVVEEADAEGVRADLVFCQAMLETGWLGFGGDVSLSQCNFAGLGATGGGVHGATFPDVRTGIRAQVQHLKLYASTDALNNDCVDPRWNAAVSVYGRGAAPTVEALAGKWASDPSYGTKLVSLMDELANYS